MNICSCITSTTSIELCIDEIEKRDPNVPNKDWQHHHNERMVHGRDRYKKIGMAELKE